VTDLSFHARWEYRGFTRSPERLSEFRSIFGNRRMIFLIGNDGVLSFYTERPGFSRELGVPAGYQEVYVS
jgi:hypothetical protein